MMNCQDCRAELSAVLSLPEEQWPPELRQHLAECAACRQEILWLQKVQAAIRADHPTELPPNLHSSIMAAIAAEKMTAVAAANKTGDSAKTKALQAKSGKRHWRFWTTAAIAAIAAVAMLIQTSGLLVRPEQTTAEVGITDTAKQYDAAADTNESAEQTAKTEQEANSTEIQRAIPSLPGVPTACEPPSDSETAPVKEATGGSKMLAKPPEANLTDPTVTNDTLLPEASVAATDSAAAPNSTADPDGLSEPTALYGLAAAPPTALVQPEPRSVQIELDQTLQEAILTAAEHSPLAYELIAATAEGSLTELKIEGTGEELVELLQGIVIPADSTVSLPVFSLQPTGDSEKTTDQNEVSVYPIGSRCVALQAGTVYQLSFEFQVK